MNIYVDPPGVDSDKDIFNTERKTTSSTITINLIKRFFVNNENGAVQDRGLLICEETYNTSESLYHIEVGQFLIFNIKLYLKNSFK